MWVIASKRSTCSAYLRSLVTQGGPASHVSVRMIERTRETARSTRGVYRLREDVVTTLGPAVTYRRRTQDESDRKIIGLVREVGVVNDRMVRLVLDIPAAVSSKLLADLVERQILVKTSDAQRGPSVTYGPAPVFDVASPIQARRRARSTPTTARTGS